MKQKPLGSRNKRTLIAVFEVPVRADLEWTKVEGSVRSMKEFLIRAGVTI